VYDAFRNVVQTQGSLSDDESARYMIRLGTSGRYFVDAW
jgi:sulfite reductase alpha subunit-like flavoprotein